MTNCVDIRNQTSENINVSRDRRKGRSDAPNFPPRETRIPVKTNIETKVESIGPATAKVYLESAAPNRKLNRRAIGRYVHAMKGGGWRVTHQGIAFNEQGQLIDGQHRLTAVIESGKTVQMNVSRYSANAPMSVLDSGVSRSVGDRVQIAGTIPAHSHRIVSVLNAMLIAETGATPADTLQPHEIEALYGQENDSINFALTAFGSGRTKHWNAIVCAAFAYCSVIDPASVAKLAESVREKAGYKKGSAAHAFVVALTDGKLSAQGGAVRIETMAKCLWLIRQHIEGKPVQRLKTTASIFNWAARQRQAKNRLLNPLIKWIVEPTSK